MDGHLGMNVVERDVPVEVERSDVKNVTNTGPAEEEQTPNDVLDANAGPWSPSQLNRALLSQTWKLNVPLPKKLLILDVNGLLVARYTKIDRSVIPMDTPHGVVAKSCIFKRPFCDSFLAFCFENFDVGFWSSMMQANVFRALDYICQGWQNKCRFIMHQGDCTYTGLKNPEKKKQPLFLKELVKVWSKFPQFNESNTLLIDDTPYKALRNPPYTAIFPEAYLYNEADIFLKGPLVEYLTQLRDALDVREFVRAHPIGLPALAPGSLHWDLYRRVLETKAEKLSPLHKTHTPVTVVPQAASSGWDSPLHNSHHLGTVVPQAAPTGWDFAERENEFGEPLHNIHPLATVIPQAALTGWDTPLHNTQPRVTPKPQAAPTGWDSPLPNSHQLVTVVPQATPSGWDFVERENEFGEPRHNTHPLVTVVPQAPPSGWDFVERENEFGKPPHYTHPLVPVVPQAAPSGWDFAERENEFGEPLPPGTY